MELIKHLNHKNLFCILLLSFFLLIGCNKISEEDYLLPAEASDSSGQVVILEDYTGQRCSTCPPAATLVANLKKFYGKQLIVVTVHATSFAQPTSEYPNDYRTTEGTAWASTFEIKSAPLGMVNRVSGTIYNPAQWAASVKTEMERRPSVTLELNNLNFNEDTRILSASVRAIFLTSVNYDTKINALILEDSIIGKQANADPNSGTTPQIEDYAFMHMLRKVEYGTWGKSFTKTSDNIKYQDTITIPLEIQINSEWKPKNCHLAVYLSTDEPAKTKDNYRIIQAVEASIIKNDDTTEK